MSAGADGGALVRLAALATRTGGRFVVRRPSRYEGHLDDALVTAIDLEREAPRPRQPPNTSSEASPASTPRAGAPVVTAAPEGGQAVPEAHHAMEGAPPPSAPGRQFDVVAAKADPPTAAPPNAEAPLVTADHVVRAEVVGDRSHEATSIVEVYERVVEGSAGRHPEAGESASLPDAETWPADAVPARTADEPRTTVVVNPPPARESLRPDGEAGPAVVAASTPADAPAITVTIGHLEVRTVEPPPPPRAVPVPAAPVAPLRFHGPTLVEFLAGES